MPYLATRERFPSCTLDYACNPHHLILSYKPLGFALRLIGVQGLAIHNYGQLAHVIIWALAQGLKWTSKVISPLNKEVKEVWHGILQNWVVIDYLDFVGCTVLINPGNKLA